ncbi:hypothetical protein ACHAWF_007148, partial [Thalassiosira exigua]
RTAPPPPGGGRGGGGRAVVRGAARGARTEDASERADVGIVSPTREKAVPSSRRIGDHRFAQVGEEPSARATTARRRWSERPDDLVRSRPFRRSGTFSILAFFSTNDDRRREDCFVRARRFAEAPSRETVAVARKRKLVPSPTSANPERSNDALGTSRRGREAGRRRSSGGGPVRAGATAAPSADDASESSEPLRPNDPPPPPLPRCPRPADEATAPDSADAADATDGRPFAYDPSLASFTFDLSPPSLAPRRSSDAFGNDDVDVVVPLAPCAYRMTDHTLAKKEPLSLSRCVDKLGVLRCLAKERDNLNDLLRARLGDEGGGGGTMEESELGKCRFLELISNCGVCQEVSEMILKRCHEASDGASGVDAGSGEGAGGNPRRIPTVRVDGLDDFLSAIEELVPALSEAREEMSETQSVSFRPGLGELFAPGAPLVCFPEGTEGVPLGASCVQCWYDEERNRATGRTKRKFVLVVEFLVSVGDELVFAAASEVYPEFPDGRSVPLKDLNHRVLRPAEAEEDAALMERLRERGAFYASVATENHYLEYHPGAFFPSAGGLGRNNASRPLSRSGRVMVDVRRGAAVVARGLRIRQWPNRTSLGLDPSGGRQRAVAGGLVHDLGSAPRRDFRTGPPDACSAEYGKDEGDARRINHAPLPTHA